MKHGPSVGYDKKLFVTPSNDLATALAELDVAVAAVGRAVADAHIARTAVQNALYDRHHRVAMLRHLAAFRNE